MQSTWCKKTEKHCKNERWDSKVVYRWEKNIGKKNSVEIVKKDKRLRGLGLRLNMRE